MMPVFFTLLSTHACFRIHPWGASTSATAMAALGPSRMGAHARASSSGRVAASLASILQWQPPRSVAAPRPQRRAATAAAAALATAPGAAPPRRGRRGPLRVRAERKEYYDFKDMPPLPLNVARIAVPALDFVVYDKACEEQRLASLAIFYDIWGDDQYGRRLTRKSAITALCMYDRDDVDAAGRRPGDYPCIDLLQRVYNQGLELELQVDLL
jgi:hypothetical protein